jgi:hypothetical protein
VNHGESIYFLGCERPVICQTDMSRCLLAFSLENVILSILMCLITIVILILQLYTEIGTASQSYIFIFYVMCTWWSHSLRRI